MTKKTHEKRALTLCLRRINCHSLLLTRCSCITTVCGSGKTWGKCVSRGSPNQPGCQRAHDGADANSRSADPGGHGDAGAHRSPCRLPLAFYFAYLGADPLPGAVLSQPRSPVLRVQAPP